MNRFALVGAAGAIGRTIAYALRSRGQHYRVIGRDRTKLEESFASDPLAEVVTWDPEDQASVRSALRGTDTLIYLVGVPYDQFQLHPLVLQKTLDGAIAEGLARAVLIGTVYPYGRPQSTPVTESHPREPPTFKGQMRKAQEDVLLKAHASGAIQGTILRLPDFYGPGVTASFLDSLFRAAAHGGTANMVGPIDKPHEFVFVPDVGPVVLDLANKSEAYGTWWNFAGAGAITQREIINQVFAMAGRKPKLRVAGKTMLRMIGLFNPFMRELVEMHYLLTTPVLMDDTALVRLRRGAEDPLCGRAEAHARRLSGTRKVIKRTIGRTHSASAGVLLVVIRCVFLLVLTVAAGPAQSNEISLHFGGTLTQRRSIRLPSVVQNLLGTEEIREDNGYAGGIVYRIRLARFGPVALMAELPLFVVQATNTDLIPLIARPIFGDTSGIAGFLTPGGVLRFLPDSRVSPYVFFGGGYARVVEAQLVSTSPLRGRFANEGTWAINYGGGADLRLLGFLALRGELRNFYTGTTENTLALPQETRQRNTLLISGGLVFRF